MRGRKEGPLCEVCNVNKWETRECEFGDFDHEEEVNCVRVSQKWRYQRRPRAPRRRPRRQQEPRMRHRRIKMR